LAERALSTKVPKASRSNSRPGIAQPVASDTPSGNTDPDGDPHLAAKKLLAAVARHTLGQLT